MSVSERYEKVLSNNNEKKEKRMCALGISGDVIVTVEAPHAVFKKLCVWFATIEIPVVRAQALANQAGHSGTLKRGLALVFTPQANRVTDLLAPLRNTHVKVLLE